MEPGKKDYIDSPLRMQPASLSGASTPTIDLDGLSWPCK